MSGSSTRALHLVLDSTAALSKFIEECEVESLATIWSHLSRGIDNPRIREMTEEVVKTTVWQTRQILRTIEDILREASREQ